ncbi:MAG TPA: MBL fold metallo-hydrolase [Bryobacteraceae bacterium]|jgi:glyoxylase-like metal-dependent hydrolase (beta-lactamase superfamily II)
MRFSIAAALMACVAWAQQQNGGAGAEIHVLPVQGNVYMLVGGGGNITVQAGKDGILLVDTGLAQLAPKIIAALRTISTGPVRYIVDTHVHADHVGGNEALAKLGKDNAPPGFPRIIAGLAVQERMAEPAPGDPPAALWPNDTYSTPSKDLSFNNEAVVVYHIPAAHTDGDSIVFFRRSDVLSAGDIFTPDRYPFIDLNRGGSVQGIVAGLNRILEIAVPLKYQEGGTYIIPGHGRLCDEADVVEFRDMVTIIRDRVQDLIKKGMSLEQVKAAKPSLDYDTQYSGSPDMFVEAIYKSLKK